MRDFRQFVRSRLPSLGLTLAREAEIIEELSQQLESTYAESLASGASPDEALRRAHSLFPDWHRLAADILEAEHPVAASLPEKFRPSPDPPQLAAPSPGGFLSGILHDLRYALRMLSKNPGFTAVAVLTLALGIGATTAIFSVVHGVLLKPLPYADPARLIAIRPNESAPNLLDVRRRTHAFESIGGVVVAPMNFTGGPEPLQVDVGCVTGDLFRTLGVPPLLGRAITIEDDQLGGPPYVVLSHSFWQRRFGGDRNILGRSLPLSGNSYTIIGVMPAHFSLPGQRADLFGGVHVLNAGAAPFRGVRFLRTYARLAPGADLTRARDEMASIDNQLREVDPVINRQRRTVLQPLLDRIVGPARQSLLILFGAVGLVLLIACANYSNLFLASALKRRQELLVRVALGAERARLIRQLVTESLLIAVLGGLAALLVAQGAISLLQAFEPENLPRLTEISLDTRVIAFAFALCLLCGLIFGLLPAFSATRANLADSLKDASRTSTAGAARSRLRNLLVVTEIALALILMTGAGLLIHTFWRLRAVEPGFNSENLLTFRIELPELRYKEPPAQSEFRRRYLETLNDLPGVQAAMVSELPLSGEWLNHDFLIEGRPPIEPGNEPELMSRTVAGDYLRLMNIPILSGRDLSPKDREAAPSVAVVNEEMVRQYFPNEDPIGKRFRWARSSGPPQWITIVGVAADVHHFGLHVPDQPAAYWPYYQNNPPWKRWQTLALRSTMPRAALAEAARAELRKLDPQLPITRVSTMEEVMASSTIQRRFEMSLLGLFASLAVTLAAVGIYGVMSYSVAQRTHEIGVRMALGATPACVLRLILAQGARLALLGLALGLIGAVALSRYVETLLFNVSRLDPLAYVLGSLLLLFVALLACFLPARRATRTDPLSALRYE